MTTIEPKDLIEAVLATRDEVDPDLESELLEAIVDAEAVAAGDGEAARRAIDVAVTAAIERGVGHTKEVETSVTDAAVADQDEEDEA